MPVALKREEQAQPSVIAPAAKPWMHVVWFAAAGLFVSILMLTYGLDLSPGLF